MKKTFLKIGGASSVALVGSSLPALAALDVTAATGEIASAGTAVAAVGGAIFAVGGIMLAVRMVRRMLGA